MKGMRFGHKSNCVRYSHPRTNVQRVPGRRRGLAAWLRGMVLNRAVRKAQRWAEHRCPDDTLLPPGIDLRLSEVERLASHALLLAADPFAIILKRNTRSKMKNRGSNDRSSRRS